jgi:putative membrane protein
MTAGAPNYGSTPGAGTASDIQPSGSETATAPPVEPTTTPAPAQAATTGSTQTAETQGTTTMASADQSQNQMVQIVPAAQVSSDEYQRKTAIANAYEVQAGQIALQRAQSDRVKQFAQQMIDQHGQAMQSAQTAELDRGHQAMLQTLRTTPADRFDQVYMSQQITAHANNAALQKGYAQSGDQDALKQNAAAMVPVVEQHLNMAWDMSEVPERLQMARNDEATMLAQNTSGSGTYRGYRVYGGAVAAEPGVTTSGTTTSFGQTNEPGTTNSTMTGTTGTTSTTTTTPQATTTPPAATTPDTPTTPPQGSSTNPYRGYTSTTNPGSAGTEQQLNSQYGITSPSGSQATPDTSMGEPGMNSPSGTPNPDTMTPPSSVQTTPPTSPDTGTPPTDTTP